MLKKWFSLLVVMLMFVTTGLFAQSITFTFANGQVTSDDSLSYYEFDVMAKAGADGTVFKEGMIYIEYSNSAFGVSIVAGAKVEVTKEVLTSGEIYAGYPYYSLGIVDNLPNRFVINIGNIYGSYGGSVYTFLEKMVHVKIEILNISEKAGLSFDQGLMAGQQFQTNGIEYAPVFANDIDDSSLPVVLTAFTSTDSTLYDGSHVCFLYWETASEINNLKFIVYRREGLFGDFVKIWEIPSKNGNSTEAQYYQWMDPTVIIGKEYYYLISDVDVLGQETFLDTILFKIDLATGVKENPEVPADPIEPVRRPGSDKYRDRYVPESPDPKFDKINGGIRKRKIPSEFELNQNYPNPFNPATIIPFKLRKTAIVHIAIFDLNGKMVKNLINEQRPGGSHFVIWNGTDENGFLVSSGRYFVIMKADSYVFGKSLMFSK
jgi:hypothetical protein